jgi:hypothetical protein
MDEKQLKLLSDKMDVMIRLLAINATSGKSVKDQIRLLNTMGMTPKQIADALGKTQNQVNVTLHDIREEEKKSDKKGSNQVISEEKAPPQTTLSPPP